MTTKTIEELATNAVKHSILTAEFLDQFIADNDKEPTWDGFVYIYTDKRKRVSDFTGRVPVQIKGRVVDNLNVDTTTFSTSTVDLRNFLYDGGAIYLLCFYLRMEKNPRSFMKPHLQ